MGSIAAREMMEERESLGLLSEASRSMQTESFIDMLCPFQLLYSDGIERLAAESARERVRWVSAIWYVIFCSLSDTLKLLTKLFTLGRLSIGHFLPFPIPRRLNHCFVRRWAQFGRFQAFLLPTQAQALQQPCLFLP